MNEGRKQILKMDIKKTPNWRFELEILVEC